VELEFENLITKAKACQVCQAHLPLGPNPVFTINSEAKVLIIGQAPGTKVHNTGIPWNDQSGKELRRWLGVEPEVFYNPKLFAIVPMGFCYPGSGKNGDLPPRPECAPLWHQPFLSAMPQIKLTLLIGKYAQAYYLKTDIKGNLTDTVASYESYLPLYFPLVHPSPRNKVWHKKNPWFEEKVVPELQKTIALILSN